jgi:iron(III) transport system substrate-binding protein
VTLKQLAESKLKGKLGRLDAGGRWIAGTVKALGPDGMTVVRQIAALEPKLFSNTSALTNALTSGQIAVAFDMHAGNVGIAMAQGAPIDYVVPEPLFLLPAYTVFLNDAPHPYAAALNYDWRLAKDGGQSFYKKFHQNGPRKDTDYAFMDVINSAKTKITLTNDVLTDIEKYDATFREIFIGK